MKKMHNWEELSKVQPSKTHYLDINIYYGNGRIRSKETDFSLYMTTHTFYNNGYTEFWNKKLQECGFDVELVPWEQQKEDFNEQETKSL